IARLENSQLDNFRPRHWQSRSESQLPAARPRPITRGADLVSLLERIRSPRDVKDLSAEELPQLAAELRDHLIKVVTKNGGHLGPNLGVVELTIALHRVFDSPVDRILFDTGHQSYVHKLLTRPYPQLAPPPHPHPIP